MSGTKKPCWAISPAAYTVRPAGSGGRYTGRNSTHPTTQLTHPHLYLRRRLMRTRSGPVRPVHQPGQPRRPVTGQPSVQGLAGHPELGSDHVLGLTTLNSKDGAIPLLDNRQLNQGQSRPPLTAQTRR